MLFCNACFVEHGLGIENGLFGGFQNGVEAAKHAHGQNNVRVFSSFEEVAKNVVGNAPDEGDNFVVSGLVHEMIENYVTLTIYMLV